MEIKELKKKTHKRLSAEQYTSELKRLRKEHEVMKKGMFEFLDAQGGWFDFAYRFFPGEPLTTIRLIHGEICDLPMGVVKLLNNVKRKVRMLGKELPEGSMRGIPSTYTVESRVRFTPMEVL